MTNHQTDGNTPKTIQRGGMDLNEHARFRESRSLETSHNEKPAFLPKMKIIKR